MKWKFCQCCVLDGHCENQDRDMKCEHYSKQLEDKVERLQEQLKEANTVICGLYHLTTDKKAASGVVCDYLVKYGKPFETESGV